MQELSSKEIVNELELSLRTKEVHTHNIKKTQYRNTFSLTVKLLKKRKIKIPYSY